MVAHVCFLHSKWTHTTVSELIWKQTLRNDRCYTTNVVVQSSTSYTTTPTFVRFNRCLHRYVAHQNSDSIGPPQSVLNLLMHESRKEWLKVKWRTSRRRWLKISSIENLVEDFDGGFDRSDKSVDGARDGEIGWRTQCKIDGDLIKYLMGGGFRKKIWFHCFYSRYFHWRQDRLKAGLDGARTIWIQAN